MPKKWSIAQHRRGLSYKPIEERLWGNVLKTDGCWLWQGGKDKNGYGSIMYQGRTTKAHRVAFILAVGSIPDGLWVLHKCDNPSCVRPDHLFAGTHKDNMADCMKKGRHTLQVHPEIRPLRFPKKFLGEENSYSKLTAAIVLEIRAMSARGVAGRAIARHFGVGSRTVMCVLKGISWKHI